jgi:cell division protein FtsB
MKIISSTALMLFALSAIWIQPVAAQSQDGQKQDIQQLKDKLQQLDQMMSEVKGEIRALEDGRRQPRTGGRRVGRKAAKLSAMGRGN